VDLKVSVNLGSDKARELARAADSQALQSAGPSTLAPPVLRLVRYIYDEAVKALTTTVAANITSRGFDKPISLLRGIIYVDDVVLESKLLLESCHFLKLWKEKKF